MGILGGSASKPSMGAPRFEKYKKQGLASFKREINKSGMAYDKRKKILGAMEDEFKGTRRLSNETIVKTAQKKLGTTFWRDRVKAALSTKTAGLTDEQKRRNVKISRMMTEMSDGEQMRSGARFNAKKEEKKEEPNYFAGPKPQHQTSAIEPEKHEDDKSPNLNTAQDPHTQGVGNQVRNDSNNQPPVMPI